MKKLFVICIIGGFFLQGCASIVSTNHRNVTISSDPDKATVSIIDEQGNRIYQGQTPTTVMLQTSAGYFKGKSYIVTVEKDDFQKQVFQINKNLNGWYFGNILFGGLIGMLIVDPLTGSMWTLDPQHIDASFNQIISQTELDALKVSFISREDIPEDIAKNMVKLN